MPVDIKVRYVVDTSQIAKAQKEVTNLQKDFNSAAEKSTKIADNFGKSLTDAIPIVLIEQAIQRTGEWAQNIQRASEQVGVASDKYQVLKTLFERSHLDEGNIKSYFDKLNTGATEAVAGNAELIQSFARLGIQYNDLKNMPTVDIFEKIMGGDITKKGVYLEKIFGGGALQDIQNLSAQFKAGGENITGKLMGEGGYETADIGVPTVSVEDIRMMSDSWTNFVNNLKEVGAALAPLGTILLTIVNGIMSMISGVVNTITGLFGDIGKMLGQISAGDWKGALKTAGATTLGRLVGIGGGIAKAATLGLANKQIDEYIGQSGFYKDLDARGKKASAGAGEAIATVLTGGEATLAKGAATGLKGARMFGGRGLGTTIKKLEGVESYGLLDVYSKSVLTKEVKKALGSEKELASIGIRKGRRAGDPTQRFYSTAEPTKEISTKEVSEKLLEKFKPRLKKLNEKASIMGGLAAATAGGVAGFSAATPYHRMAGAPDRGVGAFGYGIMGAMGGMGGGANLRMGGVFGADLQTRMIKLNEKMVDYLFAIVQNTGGRLGATAPGAFRQMNTEMH